MRRLIVLLVSLILTASSTLAAPSTQPKDWTFLIFLNGNNNLDSFGKMNIKQMEKVGSTANINVLVQWASLGTGKIQRLLIKKSAGQNVGSPVLQDLGRVDMGDWRSVVDFVKWGVQNYPAKHYFLDIWDHGSGWHEKMGKNGGGGIIQPMDISWDEVTGNHITTKQLGLALEESAKIIGHKVDLFATDACLMAMVEVAHEVADSVEIYAGSEDVEPGTGWPYDKILSRWNSTKNASAKEVAKILAEEYVKSYTKPSDQVTYSAFDLSALPAFNKSIKDLGKNLVTLNAAAHAQVVDAAQRSQSFTNSDYVDLVDFLAKLKSSSISALNSSLIQSVTDATSKLVISNQTKGFPDAHGLSMWIPSSASTFAQYSDLYSQMKFDQETHWGDALKAILK